MEPYLNIKKEQDQIRVELIIQTTRPSTKSLKEVSFGHPKPPTRRQI